MHKASLYIALLFIACKSEHKGTQAENYSEQEEIIDSGTGIEKVAGGFQFTEGPVWSPEGYLLFTDIPANKVNQYDPVTKSTNTYLEPSGNANGLAYDTAGNLYLCEHANRCISKIDSSGNRTVLVSAYQEKKLNSPNDLVITSKGAIYFTDPPWGLPNGQNDSSKELPFNGIYRYFEGKTDLLIDSLMFPNGIALSVDEKTLYIGALHHNKPLWVKYILNEEGLIAEGQLFFDASEYGPDSPDGLKIDNKGNLYCTGPKGVLVLSPGGELTGIIETPELPANCAFGDYDGKSLYITAQTGLYKIRLPYAGAGKFPKE